MKEQHKSGYCSRSWDAFEVDYTLKAVHLRRAEWEVNLAAVLGLCSTWSFLTKPPELQWPWTSIAPLRTNDTAIWTSEKCESEPLRAALHCSCQCRIG